MWKKQNSLFLEEKIKEAIQFIKDNEPPEGYLVAFSGGKDSQVVYELVKLAGVKHQVYFSYAFEPPEVTSFIRSYYPEVRFIYAKMSMPKLIVHHGVPPLPQMRYCCGALKEYVKGHVVTGVRALESLRRKNHKRIYQKAKNDIKYNLILFWSDDDIWQFHQLFNLPHCSLYDEGYKRIGCVACCMKSPKQRIQDLKRWKNFFKIYMNAFENMLKAHPEKRIGRWKTAKDVMTWWLNGQGQELFDENTKI